MSNMMKGTRRRALKLRRVFLLTVAMLALALAGAVTIPAVAPDAGASIADFLRSVVGPEPVALLESTVFQLQDTLNRAKYNVTHDGGQVAWASSAVLTQTQSIVTYYQPTPAAPPTAVSPAPIPHALKYGSPATTTTPTTPASTATPVKPRPTPTAVVIKNVVDAAPAAGTGWQAFGMLSPDQTPIMARTALKPDPSRPYANAAAIRIDLSLARLHLVPGTLEPTFAPGEPSFNRPGVIPASDALNNVLVAAFNGGFKAIHGKYGMMFNGKVILPPVKGIATVGFYRDGSIRIGAWGVGITQTADLISYRQNCPLLVDQGRVRPNINIADVLSWGYTGGNPAATWRSGLGLSQDGRFLIYVAGNSLTAQTLGNALQQAGAYYGMQLDINGFYTRFYTYEPVKPGSGSLQAVRLLQAMSGSATQYLTPYPRDFFYVTALTGTNIDAVRQPTMR